MSDMWLPDDQDPRQQEVPTRGERACLEDYLEFYRTTLELKCQDLTAAQMATRSVPPSALSLLGMVRHMTRVEQGWFRRTIEGDDAGERLFQDQDGGFDFDEAAVDDAFVAEAWQAWRDEVAHAREVLADHELDDLIDINGNDNEVRDIVVHMIEEYARHVGHADLLRERLDGRTGQ